MKKTKFLSLLVFAPLLVGCGGNSVKEPKFAKYGNEVKAAKFFEDFSKKMNKAKFEDDKAKLGSMVASVIEAGSNEEQVTRNKKEVSNYKQFQKSELKYSYDSESLVSKSEQSSVSSHEEKNAVGQSSEATAYSATSFMQVSKVQKKDNLVYASVEAKQYYSVFEVSKENPVKDYFESQNKGQIESAINEVAAEGYFAYTTSDEKEQKKFKFYENGDIFTFEWNDEGKLDRTGFDGTETGKWIGQIDLTEGKWSAKKYKEFVTEADVKDNVDPYVKGDHLKIVNKSLYEAKAELKSVKVAAQELKGFDFVS